MLADHIGIPHLRELASKEESLKTVVSALDMPRLAGLLHPDADAENQRLALNLGFQRSTGVDPGLPEIHGQLEMALELTCQRCLGVLSWTKTLEVKLVVVANEADSDTLAEPYDCVVANEHGISMLAIAEDEVLSSLPLAPMHADSTLCAENGVSLEMNMESDEVAEEHNRPFENLADMLKQAATDNKD